MSKPSKYLNISERLGLVNAFLQSRRKKKERKKRKTEKKKRKKTRKKERKKRINEYRSVPPIFQCVQALSN